MKVSFNTLNNYDAFCGKRHKKGGVNKKHKDTFIKTKSSNATPQKTGLGKNEVKEYVDFYFTHDEDNKATIYMLMSEKPERYKEVIKKIDEIEAQEAAQRAKEGTLLGLFEDIRASLQEVLHISNSI